MKIPRLLLAAAIPSLLVAATAAAQAPAPRPVRPDDLYRIRDVRDPQLSPDGKWVAYTVSAADSAKDRTETDVWMVGWDGGEPIRVTSTPGSESSPSWSPDGRYLAFLSSRQESGGSQVWLLDRRGGEAQRLTAVKGGVEDYAWSPDGRRLVLVVGWADTTTADPAARKAPEPIVIDRYTFKTDGSGYLAGRRNSHLHLFDVEARKSEILTPGPFEEGSPAWSPDGTRIAFVSKRADDPDRTHDSNVYVIEARPGATPRQLTTSPGWDESPRWSPDGSTIAYLQGGDPKYSAYNRYRLAVVPAAGGAPRVLTGQLDRSVSSPRWTADGSAVHFIVTDDRARHLARVGVDGASPVRVVDGRRVVSSYTEGPGGALAVLAADAEHPAEVFAVEGGELRRLSRHNDAWLSEVRLGTTEEVEFATPDGAEVHGLLVRPPGYVGGRKYPLLLRIHGGPNGQDQLEFNHEREVFAANGYLVLAVNYRGSAGRDAEFQTSIFGDWGNKEVVDLLAGVDHVVARGMADPERLGIGGWSYGGILTNYTIATDPRFKAAISGAGSSLQLTMYGTDQYVWQYEEELGPPWENPEAWIKVSYPFFHADRITTPTLFLAAEADFNVPVSGSEQMYQALRTLGVPTRLVIYPGQHHGLAKPSYRVDRLNRYLEWYGRYLAPTR